MTGLDSRSLARFVTAVTACVIHGTVEVDLEPLALPDFAHLAEPQPVARAGDGIPLRVMNLRLEHYFHDHSGHVSSRAFRAYIFW